MSLIPVQIWYDRLDVHIRASKTISHSAKVASDARAYVPVISYIVPRYAGNVNQEFSAAHFINCELKLVRVSRYRATYVSGRQSDSICIDDLQLTKKNIF